MEHDLRRFSPQELETALTIVLPRMKARNLVRMLLQKRNADAITGQPYLSDDILDLLLLVSASCAERVGATLRLSPEEVEAKRVDAENRFRKP